MHADPVDMASIVNRQYESVFTKEEEDEDTQVIQEDSYPEVTNIMISQEGVLSPGWGGGGYSDIFIHT